MTIDGPYTSPLATLGIAQIETLNSLPTALVPAPGLGKFLLPISAIATFEPGIEAITGGGTVAVGPGALALSGVRVSLFSGADIQGTSPLGVLGLPNGLSAVDTDLENLALYVFASGDFVGGPSVDAKMRISVQYYIVTNGWS